jgi:biopolymer transport protein ExbD
MKFSTRKRRQAPTIIIISLIDILIVLLIFLMVTTTFKQQPSLRLVLPETKQAKPGNSENTHNLVVTVAKQEPFFYLGSAKHAITSERLQEELTSNAKRDPAVSLSLWPDTGAPFGEVLKAWDAAATAGITNVHLVAKRPDQH